MNESTTNYTQLEMRRKYGDEWCIWTPVNAGMYATARRLTYERRFVEALQTAEEAYIASCGDMRYIEFRILEHTQTVITL